MYTQFNDLIGKTFTEVTTTDDASELLFVAATGERYKFYHYQDCCESVGIEDIIGDLSDLIGAPLLMAEEVSNDDAPELPNEESYTWTFYKFATIKGYVTVRWLGTSNGYYSEAVNFMKLDD